MRFIWTRQGRVPANELHSRVPVERLGQTGQFHYLRGILSEMAIFRQPRSKSVLMSDTLWADERRYR